MKNIGGIGDICQNEFTLQRENLWQGWVLEFEDVVSIVTRGNFRFRV